ncbi:MAG: arsenate reductase (glutaredoxin) [Wenzhouxiangella sp.]
MTVTIYHNPRCSKSRQTLALIRDRGIEPEIIEYLKQPPDAEQLKRTIAMLGITVHELVRGNEPEYSEENLDEASSEQRLIEAMVKHPRLIQRPIVVVGDQARIGRPPENVEAILP